MCIRDRYKRYNPFVFLFLLANNDEAVRDNQLHRFRPTADTHRPRAFSCVSGEVELALVRDIRLGSASQVRFFAKK